MVHEAQRIRLRRLAAQIETARIAVLFSHPKEGSHDRAELDRQITGWQEALKGTQRDLKSKSNFNQMVYQQERFGAGAHAAKQRLHSQDNNVRELALLAARVSDALFGLLRALSDGPGPEARALKGLEASLKNWMKSTQTEEELFSQPVSAHVQTEIKALRQINPEPFPDAPGPMGPIDFFTFVLSLFVLAKALNKRRD